jgi:phosphoribosylformylglycinamidine synthase
MEFLHDGLPRFHGEAEWTPPERPDPLLPESREGVDPLIRTACRRALDGPGDWADALRRILAAPNVRSKEWIVRQYDHEVQGQTVLKPFVGAENDGPGDAAVLTPVLGSHRAVAIACGMNPRYGDVDPYHSAACAIDEALRNIVSVGGSIDRTAILDNFCWGNTGRPQQLGTLVRAALACYDYAVGFGVPFISGKDSLNNEFNTGEEVIAIPPTLLISAIAVIDDVRRTVTMDLKEPGNALYLVGDTRPELGGSHYLELFDLVGNTPPVVRVQPAREAMRKLHEAIRGGLVRSCHDLSEGGLAVAAAEMGFAGEVGFGLDLSAVPYDGPADHRRNSVLMFSESASRFLVEVDPDDAEEFERALAGVPVGRVGETADTGVMRVTGLEGGALMDVSLASLKKAWQTPLVPHPAGEVT